MYIEYVSGQKYPTKNAPISDSFEGYQDAGYLIEDNEVIVDIDHVDKKIIEAMIDVFDIKTQIVWTDRGCHLYYIKPPGFNRNKGITALGFEVEYLRNKVKKSVTVKRNGITRKIENLGEREILPDFLNTKRNYENLLGLQEGENRNNLLFVHKNKLGAIKDKLKILNFINNYVFAEALDQKEFDTVVRDTGVVVDKDAETLTAEMIMKEYKIVSYKQQLYFYQDNHYVTDEEVLTRIIVQYCKDEKSRYIKEVLEQLKLKSPLEQDRAFPIKFKNGILYNGSFIEADYEEFTPYYLDIEYDFDVPPVKEVDDYLDQLSNNNLPYRQRILEVMAHCFVVDKEFKRLLAKFFIFIGDGGNGKGTLLQVIKKILGAHNCGSLSIKQMKDERYLNTLHGKLCNLGDDLQDEPINNDEMKLLKNISTCDGIMMRKLYENAQDVQFSCSLIFTSNHIIKSFEKSDAYRRRVDWMPIFTKPKTKDRRFISKITTEEALKYWIRLIVEAYQRLYKNSNFTKSEIVDKYNQRYHEENDNTLVFTKELHDNEIENRKPKEVYDDYVVWCDENGEKPLSQKQLRQNILAQRGYDSIPTKIHGKTARVFKKIK